MNLERSDGLRPNNSLRVIVNFYQSRKAPADANSIRTHDYRFFASVFVGESQVKSIGISSAKFEHIANLDSIGRFNIPAAFRTSITVLNYRYFFVLREIAFGAVKN